MVSVCAAANEMATSTKAAIATKLWRNDIKFFMELLLRHAMEFAFARAGGISQSCREHSTAGAPIVSRIRELTGENYAEGTQKIVVTKCYTQSHHWQKPPRHYEHP